jgi:hypothetical protein
MSRLFQGLDKVVGDGLVRQIDFQLALWTFPDGSLLKMGTSMISPEGRAVCEQEGMWEVSRLKSFACGIGFMNT